ncbi:hypothetical protein ACFLZY_00720 [Patescibacteria group bacterium]
MFKKNYSSYIIVAGLLIGIGVGLYLDEAAAGTLIGLGAGFLVAFVTNYFKKK